ncbi:hypothetical protein [Phaeodactylibacter xiamenensis]|jgi:hypothetical protein|nr:hypothetical protein [Phaeodactylibacter xiamenensis]
MNNWKHYAALATVTVIATVIAGLIVDHYQEMKLKKLIADGVLPANTEV